jgi:hypothetical protein
VGRTVVDSNGGGLSTLIPMASPDVFCSGQDKSNPTYSLWSLNIAIENGPFLVDLPIDSMVIFHTYASLPEGNPQWFAYFSDCKTTLDSLHNVVA